MATILIVDDDRNMRLLTKALEKTTTRKIKRFGANLT